MSYMIFPNIGYAPNSKQYNNPVWPFLCDANIYMYFLPLLRKSVSEHTVA